MGFLRVDPEALDLDHGLVALAALAERHGARLVRTETSALWNRARALNLGIQASSGDLVLCTDADMLFSPDFLSAVAGAHAAAADHGLVLCRCHDLPAGAVEHAAALAEFDDLRARSEVRQTSGTGACQAAKRSFFCAVRGYDEAFVYWGAEDNDMVHRAGRYGLKAVWLDETPAMLHQWHTTMKNDRPLRRKWNSWRYKLTKWQVVKNRGGWGNEPAG